jgi:hypothetical protein
VLLKIAGVVDKDIHRFKTVGKTMWITAYKVENHWAIGPVDKFGDKYCG